MEFIVKVVIFLQPLWPLALSRFHCPPVWFIYSLLLLLLHYEEHVVQLVVQVAWHPIPIPHTPYPIPFSISISICDAIHPLPLPLPPFNHPLHPWLLCYRISFLCCLATVWTDLLNIIHIVDGQWFLLANKKLNVGLVCWLDLVTCSSSVSPSYSSSLPSSCFHSHSHSSCSSRLVQLSSCCRILLW